MGPRLRNAAVILAGLAPVIAAGACSTEPPTPYYPELTYEHLGKIRLDVARVDITTNYIPPLKSPNVEHRAPIPPYALIRRWGSERLVAAGGRDKVARLVILDASIKEARLKVRGGVKGMITREQAARYDGRAAVLLEIRDFGGRQLAFVTARATRSATVPEGASIADRERVWFTMSEDLVTEINRQLDREIREHFAPYRAGG